MRLTCPADPPSLDTPAQPVRPRWPSGREWLAFGLQVLIVGVIQSGNDIIRGNVFRPSAREAVDHAEDLIAFERAHGFFVEPAFQTSLQGVHAFFGLITWHSVIAIDNGIYAIAHLVIPLLVAMWVFVRHRGQFPLVRNIFVLTGLLALVGYELYPLAPPRLTPPVLFDGHLFHFKDTMQHIIGTGKINDTPIGYNPYSAMPSLHFAWALIVALILALMVQNPVIRFLALCYPATMLYAVVVTGNHFLLDAAGAAGAVALAVVLAFGVERGLARARLAHRRRFRATASGR